MQGELQLEALHAERFEVLGTLGVGGMGSVFRARDRTLDRQVALKLVRPELLRNDEARSRFLREGRILSQFNHPNLCQLYDYVQGATSDVLVMELVEGQTLAAMIEGGATQSRSRAERLDWMLALTQALGVAHGAGIIHRDLKPANVMVTPSGGIKVLDFGIARDDSGLRLESLDAKAPSDIDIDQQASGAHADHVHTQAGRVMGTPKYMSPEQKRGADVTAASDLFALGLILEEVLKPRRSAWRDRELTRLIAELTANRAIDRPSASSIEMRLKRLIAKPRRRVLQTVAVTTGLAFLFLTFRYVRDLGQERDLVVARQGQSERLIGFLVDEVAERLEEIGSPELLAELDRQSIDYFHAVDAAQLSDSEMRWWVEAMLGVGQRIRTHDRLSAAREVYLAAETFLNRRLEAEPLSSEWRFEAGQVAFYLGEIARDQHDLDGALEAWTRYRDLSAELLLGDPENEAYQREMTYAKTNLGVLAFERGELSLAESYFRDALEYCQQRAQEEPGQAEWIVEQADLLSWVSQTLRSQGQFSAALSTDREVRRIQQQQLESDSGNRLYEHRYVLSLFHEARSLSFVGQHLQATDVAQKAYAGALKLSHFDPNQGDWARTCALTASYAALNLLTLGRVAEAEPILAAARLQLDEMRARDPNNQDWQALSTVLHGVESEAALARGDLALAQAQLAKVELGDASLGPRLNRGDPSYLEVLRMATQSLAAQATGTAQMDPLLDGLPSLVALCDQESEPAARWKLERVVLIALLDSGHLELARTWRDTQLVYFVPSAFLEERQVELATPKGSDVNHE